MKQQLLKPILMAAFVIFGFTNVFAQTTTFSTGLEGWSTGYGGAAPVTHVPTEGIAGDGALQLDRKVLASGNNNANFGLASTPGIDATTIKVIRIVYKNGTNGSQFRVQGGNDMGGSITNTIFAITPNSTEWVTSYLDMTGVAGWDFNIDNLDILLRVGYAASEGELLVDEIEFLTSIPAQTTEGIIQNASFEYLGGQIIPWNPAGQTYASVIVSSEEPKTGNKSLKHEYSAVPSGTHFVFNDYVHDFGATQTGDIGSSIWVKVVRPSTPGVSPTIQVQGQVRTGTTTVVASLTTQGQNKPTTQTDGTWEKITFDDTTPAAAYSTAQFRYGILATNLQVGDIVYVDDLVADLATTLTVGENTLDKFSIYPNPVKNTLNIESQGVISNVAVYDLLGKEVLLLSSNNVSNTLDVSTLSNGVYILKLTSDKGVATKKFIKE